MLLVGSQFARFEQIVERLVEGPLARLFAGRLPPQEIVAQLARAMEDNARGPRAPDLYAIHLNAADRHELLEAEPDLERLLSDQVVGLAREAGLDLFCAPVVDLLSQPDAPRQFIAVSAEVTSRTRERTETLDPAGLRRSVEREPDGADYLVVEGRRHVALTRSLYTLGRSADCDVVVSDPHVSRRHAQLRWRFGRFVLYDLGSVAGTEVNGRPVTEAVLEPGDVFSLGGVDVIFGRDPTVRIHRSAERRDRTPMRPRRQVSADTS